MKNDIRRNFCQNLQGRHTRTHYMPMDTTDKQNATDYHYQSVSRQRIGVTSTTGAAKAEKLPRILSHTQPHLKISGTTGNLGWRVAWTSCATSQLGHRLEMNSSTVFRFGLVRSAHAQAAAPHFRSNEKPSTRAPMSMCKSRVRIPLLKSPKHWIQ